MAFSQSSDQLPTHLSPSLDYHISKKFSNQNLPPLSWILEEGDQPLAANDLFTDNIKDASLIDLSGEGIFDMKAHRNYWFKIRLTSQIELDEFGVAYFRKGNSWPWEFTFKEVDSYLPDSDKIGKTGTLYPSSVRDYSNIIKPSILRTHINNDTLVQWIRVTMAERGSLRIGMSLLSRAEIAKPTELDSFHGVHMLLFGATIALFLLALLMYLWFRDWVYCWFMLFQFFLLTSSVSLYFQNTTFIFFHETPRTMVLLATILSYLRILSLLQFGRVYVVTKVKFPRLHKILGIALLILFFITVLGIVFRMNPYEIGNLWFHIRQIPMAFVMLAIFLCLIYLVLSKDKLARVYSFGILLPFGLIIFRLIEMNLTNSTESNNTSLIVNSGMMLTMTLALAYRFKIVTLERAEALQKKLNIEKQQTEQLQKINIASNAFVPQTFLNFLGKKNILDATLGDFVEKQVNVLFSDIRDYTSLSEKMSPEETFKFVSAFNRRMGPIIQEYGGFINQYLGDGIMAIFPEKADKTLFGAVEMQRALVKYNQKRRVEHKEPIRMGIGLHTGSLIMGIIGDGQRMDAATISDTVNVASRIESLTKEYKSALLISEEFYDKIENKESFNFRYLGKINVKGKKNPIDIYECFDGDQTEVRNLKKQSLHLFKEAMQFYLDKDFEKAISSFESVLKFNEKDATAQLFIEKAKLNLGQSVNN